MPCGRQHIHVHAHHAHHAHHARIPAYDCPMGASGACLVRRQKALGVVAALAHLRALVWRNMASFHGLLPPSDPPTITPQPPSPYSILYPSRPRPTDSRPPDCERPSPSPPIPHIYYIHGLLPRLTPSHRFQRFTTHLPSTTPLWPSRPVPAALISPFPQQSLVTCPTLLQLATALLGNLESLASFALPASRCHSN